MMVVMHKKWLVGVCLVLLLGMLIVGYYFLKTEPTKADKSNAVQVTSRIEAVDTTAKIDFFTEYRIERDKLRSERSEVLRESIQNANNEDSRRLAQEGVLKLMQEKERETEMESLIKAKGFADVLVFSGDKTISAVIKASSLSKEEVMQVADIISRVANVKQDAITISAKP